MGDSIGHRLTTVSQKSGRRVVGKFWFLRVLCRAQDRAFVQKLSVQFFVCGPCACACVREIAPRPDHRS